MPGGCRNEVERDKSLCVVCRGEGHKALTMAQVQAARRRAEEARSHG